MQAWLAAAQPLLAPAFMAWGSPVTWLELLAFALSLAMVWANMRVVVAAWPLAIAASALYALLFANSKLYGEAALQLLFIAVSAWGWWCWGRLGASALALHKGVRSLGHSDAVLALGTSLIAWPLVGWALAHMTDSDVPYWDALATVGSVLGQVLLARKFVQNWLVWLGVNVFSAGLFAYKGLWLTLVLYALFAMLSWIGWRSWRRLLDEPTHAAARR